MKLRGDQSSIGFGRGTIQIVALTGLVAGAAIGGAGKALVRFNTSEAGAEVVGMEATDMAPAAEPEVVPTTLAVDAEPTWDLPNLDHPRVDYWVKRFTTDKRGEFSRFLSRSGRYIPMISEKLEERGMPRDLVYLAMIESGFNPKAYSRANASGLWQFIAETGRRYGLEINRAVDERNDPVEATDAALDYLTYLHGRFGSWYLAAAGYNTGENRVGRIMRQVTGSERGNEYSYYEIWNRLPRETRDYVPLMIAAARISKEPEKYGFGEVEIAEAIRYDEVVVPASTPLSTVADAAGTSVSEIRERNPHFKLNRTRNDMASPVRLPSGSGASFAANWARVENSPTFVQAKAPAQTRSYRVRRGDNLTRIARRYGVTIAQLRRTNGLRGDRIRAGSVLRIPT
ncbi:MAG: transglycosylase SLT domain-containing protein [Gemmatimonas sp.]|nr:transglycosylase SLT domain-containing protein [Gemmatimonas sp.]